MTSPRMSSASTSKPFWLPSHLLYRKREVTTARYRRPARPARRSLATRPSLLWRSREGARRRADDDGGVTEAPPTPTFGDAGASHGEAQGSRWIAAGALVIAALVPLTLMGPGTDLDVRAVLGSGASIVDGHYIASRAPGAPVHEAAVGLLGWIGSPPFWPATVGPNLGSLVAGVVLTALLALLLRREGVGRVGLSVAVVVGNPWFLVAATSTVDFLWALALWAGAAVVLRTHRSIGGAAVAAGLAGLAVGCRSSTAVLVVALALTEAFEQGPGGDAGPGHAGRVGQRIDSESPPDAEVQRIDGESPPDGGSPAPRSTGSGPRVRGDVAEVRAAVLLVGAALTALVVYLPPFLAAESSLAFAQNDVPTSSLLVQVGRFLAKDLYFVGPFAAVALLVALPAMVRALRRWRADWLVRLGVLTVVASQLLFLRFPWKMGHLLPTLVGLALLLARALDRRPRLLWTLVAAQLLYGVVNIQLLAPDNPNAATGAELTFEPRWGALVVDTQCRLDDPSAWRGPTEDDDVVAGTPLAIERLGAVWDCAKPWAR